MKNLATKQFESKINEVKSKQIESIERQFQENILKIESLKFEKFTNEDPYVGPLENKIFFTYSNHYRANSGTWMSVNELNNPHTNYEDRGYIKGVATDLTGFMLIRSSKSIAYHLHSDLWFPNFRKSKNSEAYKETCRGIVDKAKKELDELVKTKIDIISLTIKELTGISLFYYLREI